MIATHTSQTRHHPQDPWAHRRAEPRGLALCWTLYLFAATAVATGSVGLRGAVSIEGMRLAAEMLLVSVGAGMIVLWPMLRLSQLAAPRPGIGWAAGDAFAIAMPAQAVIWPQIWLARWSPIAAIAAATLVLTWTAVVSGLLALTFSRDHPPAQRAWWMALFVILGLSGPVVSAVSPVATGGLPLAPHQPPTHWSMLSPVSGLRDLAQSAPARTWVSPVRHEQWIMIGATAIVGGVLWLGATTRARLVARTRSQG